MRRHAKASTAGSTTRQATGRGRFLCGVDASRGLSLDARGASRFAVSLVGVICLLGLISSPASALQTHPFLFKFATGATGGLNDGAVAVDQSTGDIYVGDSEAQVIRKFDSSGNPADFSALGTNVLPNVLGWALAVDPTSGDIYARTSGNLIKRFSPSGDPANFTAGSAAGTNVLNGDETPTGHFTSFFIGLAVDSGGSLYVSQNSQPAVIDKFSASGAYAGLEIASPSLQFPTAIAVDSSGAIYDLESANKEVIKFDSLGALISTIGTEGRADGGLAVDPVSDALYVAYGNAFAQFSSGGVAEGQFGDNQIRGAAGIAVNSASVPDSSDGRVYVHDRQRKSVEVFGPMVLVPDVSTGTASSAQSAVTINGTVNTAGTEPADALTDCHFEYVTEAAFMADEADGFSDLSSGGSAPCASSDGSPITSPGEIPDDASDHLVSAIVTGFLPNTHYRFRLVAANSNGPNRANAGSFTTAGPPTIGSLFASDVSATAAVVGGEANPHFLSSSYRFQYVDDATFQADVESAGSVHGFDHAASVPVAGGDLGSGGVEASASAQLAGLSPDTTYHYRLVVENAAGSASAERTFQTQRSGLGFALADRRAWEMVSPPSKFGSSIVLGEVYLSQVAPDGSGIAYESLGSIEANPEGGRAPDKSTVLARRGPDGWHSKDITVPHARVTSPAGSSEYKVFTPDLASALLEQPDSTPLSPDASERTPYLRKNAEPAVYTPLVTGKEGSANVPPGTEFGGGQAASGPSRVAILGANPALTHVVLISETPLVPGAPPLSLYEWAGGQLQLINELPASEGGGIATVAKLGSEKGSVRHAISDDGSRVFWGAGGEYNASGVHLKALYMRDTVTEETARLDVVQPGVTSSGEAHPAFQGASADGSVVFFTDSRRLTEDASPEGRDLYRCEVAPIGGTPGCASLTDISAPIAGSGESAKVLELVSALSEDGTHVYFVSRGVLDAAANQAGDTAVTGEPNLYLWRQGQGTRFIAALSQEDRPDWGYLTDQVGYVSQLSAASSPSGRYFSFMSERSLTGYENRDALNGEPVEEVFLYDAVAGRLDCISCNPSGARPVGQQQPPVVGELTLRDPQALWPEQWVAAVLPEALKAEPNGGNSYYRPRAVLDSGRVFFNAVDSLVPADSNGEWDVYQHEPIGLGDCRASSGAAAIVRSGNGCVSLISSGTAEEESAFFDASVSGDDVFFITTAKLSVTDEDAEKDIYDARVDGIPAELSPSNECLGEACQPPPFAPNDPTPASAGFKGAGNLRPKAQERCAKGRRQVTRNGKSRCVTRKHKRHQHRAGQDRRAGR